jgi:protein-S-isoprenylcysteine O-methyltransferase Ste14
MLSHVTRHLSLVTVFLRLVDSLALFYLLLIVWIPFFWFLFHPAIRFWRRWGNRAFWVALPVWLGCAAGLILSRQWLFGRRLERDTLTWVVGGVLFVVASWLEARTRRTFGFRRLVGLPELHPEHRLRGVVRTGIYAHVRHPRYLLYMLMLVSMALLTGALAIFLLAILNILLYQFLAPLEERELLDQYGLSYEAYRRSVPRFVPRMGRRPEAQISS